MGSFPRRITWDNWGALMGDVNLFAPLVKKACASFGYEPTEIRAGFPGTHAVFCVDECYVVKIYAPLQLPDEAAERACYRAIAAHAVPLTPALYAQGVLREEGHTWPYIVIEYLPGKAVRDVWGAMPDAARGEIARELADWAVKYHALPDPFAADSPLSKDGWERERGRMLKKNLARLRDEFSARESLVEELSRFAKARLAARARDTMLIHSDLTEDHLLIEGQRRFVIDFADSRMAYECLEWVPLWFGLLARDSAAFGAFLDGCGHALTEDTRGELLLGVLLHGFGAPILADALGERMREIGGIDGLSSVLPTL